MHSKEKAALESVNTALLCTLHPDEITMHIERAGEAEMDETWSFIGKKGNQRWLWHAIDHHTGAVLAMSLATEKMRSFSGSKRCSSPLPQ